MDAVKKRHAKIFCGNLDTSLLCFADKNTQLIVFGNDEELFI